MGVYRVEASPNNRAGCINKECKDKATKITKGELRFAVQVTIKDHQSWQYKHWGCVTPKQIDNLIESSGGDTEMVDGYDDLPSEFQEKIDYALANGHVHDEDWNGDVEANRDGHSGMRLTKAQLKKKAKEAGEDVDGDEKPKKKRAKKVKAEDDADEEADAPAPKKKSAKAKKADSDAEDAPAPKKRGRPAKKDVDVEDDAPAPKKARAARGKKVEYKEEEDDDDEAPPKNKAKAKARKAAAADSEDEARPEEEVEEDEIEEQEEEAPKPKRTKKSTNGATKAPQKRGRKKAVADDE
ncbi:hypothetical protein E8E13_011267 [Curvularia kusanoi]|uniref:PARP-type domain-containing protein n=1 Tax=Curvularia kusanoi TaxID=90978 RepID=A0A9P4WD44_CURKU|nr:hypothetical protein E8E13_011267 [Curvularia kusanoi]